MQTNKRTKMGRQLFCILLAINAFVKVTETLNYSYRFKVYPVDECPLNKDEFRTAERRRNCTGNSRYLCAPDKNLTSLIEFCTDQKRSLYHNDNCLKLDGSGFLNHYSCVDKFFSGCPTGPYTDDEIYKYPACLSINRNLKCFVADKNCRERHSETTEAYDNESSIDNNAFIVVIVLLLMVLLGLGGAFIYSQRRRRKAKDINGKKIEEEIKVDNLPIEINEQNLREFLSKGELTVCHVRCIIVGCAGAGKTTLLRRLEDFTFEKLKSIESTEIVDVHVNSFEVLEDEETIESVDKENDLPAIPLSKNAIDKKSKISQADETQNNTNVLAHSVKSEDGSVKSEQTSRSRKTENRAENYKTEKGFINSKERTEKMDNDGGDCFGETEISEIVETKQEEKSLRKKIAFPEGSENDTSEDARLLRLSDCKKEIVKEDKENESCTLLPNSPDDAFSNSKRKDYSSRYDSKESIRTHLAVDDDENYAISKIMDDLKKQPSEKLARPRISFIDFAGQSLYYAFHQIYLSPKTCYILVMDITKNPNEKVLEPDGEDIECSRFKSWKYRDYNKFWLQSIHSYSDTKTPVILVCTHEDKTSKQEYRKYIREFFEFFEDDYPYLRQHLHHDRTFAIGFPTTGSELKNLKDIKKCIAKLVRDSKSFEEQIRPVWAVFEYILQRKKTKRIISRQDVSNTNSLLSEELQLNEEEITKMLNFLHRVGSLLYFDEKDLDKTIILDIQWFVNAFKSLIKISVDLGESDIIIDRFKSTGVINDEMLTNIWAGKAEEGYIEHKEKILAYMERLGLLAVQHDKKAWYYIPSMNKREFKEEDIEKGDTKSSILCFHFDEKKQLPVFLFYGIVLKCIPTWCIRQKNDKFCLYENAACFEYSHHIVVVCLCKFQIQVQVSVPAQVRIDDDVLGNVQRFIEEKIQEYKGYDYEIGYKCQRGKLNNKHDNSFIPKKNFPVSKLFCDGCTDSKGHYIDNSVCWIRAETQETEDTQHTEANEETDEGLISIRQIERACLDGNLENFHFHLEKEIRPRHHLLMKSDDNGWTVLHFAAKGGNREIFSTLVSENLSICQKTHAQMTVLHIASKFGHYDICKFILHNDDFRKFVCEKSSEGKNACHYAAEAGSVKLLMLLVNNGIEANAVTNKEMNIFHIACVYNQLEMCAFIFHKYKDLVNAKSEEGWTAALHAAKNGNTNVLKILVEKEVSLCHKSDSDRNALHIACDNGHLETCKFLMETNSSLLSEVDEKGRYSVHFAARNGNLKLLMHLQSKTELTKETKTGMNILHMACLHDHIEMCSYLINKYPDLNVKRTANGWTTAHYVAGRGINTGNEIKIFKILKNAKKPVELNHLSKNGNSVLTLAIKYNVFELAEYLFENHRDMLYIPDSNDPSDTGNTHPRMLKLLEKYL